MVGKDHLTSVFFASVVTPSQQQSKTICKLGGTCGNSVSPVEARGAVMGAPNAQEQHCRLVSRLHVTPQRSSCVNYGMGTI